MSVSKPIQSSSSPKNSGGDVLCFVVDTTGSMASWIDALVKILTELVDAATMTQCFDAIGILEYGDYDSSWCASIRSNTFCYNEQYRQSFEDGEASETAVNAIPVRFSGWGLIGEEHKRTEATRVVVENPARVSVSDVHSFAKEMRARGGGGWPEAFKTAMHEFGLIAEKTLSPTTTIHVMHLTDAPMHIADLDSEGKKEKAYFQIAGVKTLATPSSGKFKSNTTEGPFHYAPIIRTLLTRLRKQGNNNNDDGCNADDPKALVKTFPTNSRLRFSSVCSNPAIAGPYAVLAFLTGGTVVNPADTSVTALRQTLVQILNIWLGISDPKEIVGLGGGAAHRCCALIGCDNQTVAVPSSSASSVLLEYDVENGYTATMNAAPNNVPITVQPGPSAAVKRCLKMIQKGTATAEYQEELAACLRRCCTTNPMALCANPVLGKIWRFFTKRRDDPRRGEFLALLDAAKRSLTGDDLATFTAWNTNSYNATDEIRNELSTFVKENGVRGLVYFEGGGAYGEAPFVPQSITNAFMTMDNDAQKQIAAILVRMRVDAKYRWENTSPEEPPAAAANEKAKTKGKATDDAKEGDETASDVCEDEEEEDDDAQEAITLPFPENALPLNLPPKTFFRLLLHPAVAGTSLSLRPSAILAALAVRSGCQLRRAAASYLQSIKGKWINFGDMSDGSGVPRIPENYSPAFMRCMLAADTALVALQARTVANHAEQKKPAAADMGTPAQTNDSANSNDAAEAVGGNAKKATSGAAGTVLELNYDTFITEPIITPTERAAMRKLLRLVNMTRADNWEVTAKIFDVTSTDAVTADYVLACTMCKKDRPMSIVAGDGVCGYCKYSKTPEGEAAYGRRMVPNPDLADGSKKAEAAAGGAPPLPAMVPITPAPSAADPQGTFQVRCTACSGYFSRDRDALVTVKSKCYYCLAGAAADMGGPQSPEKQKAIKESILNLQKKFAEEKSKKKDADNDDAAAPPASATVYKKASAPMAHLHECRSCHQQFVGAPSRPLPNNSTCAACFAGLPPRTLATVSKPMRVSKIFPYSLFWREMVSLTHQTLRDADLPKKAKTDPKAYKVTCTGGLPAVAKAFVIPGVGLDEALVVDEKADKDSAAPIVTPPTDSAAAPTHVDPTVNNMDGAGNKGATTATEESGDDDNISLPPNHWTAFVAASRAENPQTDIDDPLPSIANAKQIWSHIICNIRKGRSGGGSVQCVLCCGDFRPGEVRPVCGRRGCSERMCNACAVEWYGGSSAKKATTGGESAPAVNKIGCILAPRRLYCPCCARAPSAHVLRATNADIVYAGGPEFYSKVAAIDTNANYVAWCAGCAQPQIHSEKRCFAAEITRGDNDENVEEQTAAALGAVKNFMCERCTELRAAATAAAAQGRTAPNATASASSANPCVSLKNCPSCSVLTFRISGCHHISCPCGAHWCFECGKDCTETNDVYGHDCNGSAEATEVIWHDIEDGEVDYLL